MKKIPMIAGALLASLHASAGLIAYDVGDYVQDGLVAQYDGIRNTGRNLPHDSFALIWKNIATNSVGEEALGCDLAFIRENQTVAMPDGFPRTWANGNAYAFNGTAYAQMMEALDLLSAGKNLTIEIALGESAIEPSMCLLRPPTWYGVAIGGGDNLIWGNVAKSGMRPTTITKV